LQSQNERRFLEGNKNKPKAIFGLTKQEDLSSVMSDKYKGKA